MTDILVQFHATVEELAAFIRNVIAENRVQATAFRFHPFSATPVDIDAIGVIVGDPTVRELALTIDQPKLPVTSTNEFLDRNPSALRFDIGRLSDRGLNESCISARTTDETAIEVWKRVAGRLRTITRTGAVAANPTTGATSNLQNHRFTVGAKELDDKGVIIRPVAGSSVLHFRDK